MLISLALFFRDFPSAFFSLTDNLQLYSFLFILLRTIFEKQSIEDADDDEEEERGKRIEFHPKCT